VQQLPETVWNNWPCKHEQSASCIIIVGVAVSIEESAIGTTITITSNNEQFNHPSSLVAMPRANFLRRKSRRRRLVAISLTFVPIATTDSLTTSALAKPQSAAPADRLDEKYATSYDKPKLTGNLWIPTTSLRSASHKPHLHDYIDPPGYSQERRNISESALLCADRKLYARSGELLNNVLRYSSSSSASGRVEPSLFNALSTPVLINALLTPGMAHFASVTTLSTTST
jgi:hypothetical protein